MRVIGIELVLLARIALGPSTLAASSKIAALDLFALGRRLDHEARPRPAAHSRRRARCARASLRLRRRRACPSRPACASPLPIARLRLVDDRQHRRSSSSDLVPAGGRSLGDARAHLPRADDAMSHRTVLRSAARPRCGAMRAGWLARFARNPGTSPAPAGVDRAGEHEQVIRQAVDDRPAPRG